MSRSMWILAAIFAVLAIAMIYQSNTDEGINRPWAACKENLSTNAQWCLHYQWKIVSKYLRIKTINK